MSLTFPDDRHYHSEHLWAQEQADGTVRIGISDFAQDQLGSIIFVDMPAVGAHFTQGNSCASIESVKVVSEAIIPRSGTVTSVNDALADQPELINDSPYQEGWLIQIRPDSAEESGCLNAEAYSLSLPK